MDGLLVDLRDNVSITVYFDFTYSGLHRCIVFFSSFVCFLIALFSYSAFKAAGCSNKISCHKISCRLSRIRWGTDPPCECVILRGERHAQHARRHSDVNCAKRLNRSRCRLSYGLWWAEGSSSSIVFTRWRQCAHMAEHIGTPPDEYDWTVRLRWRCGLMSNFFDHLLFFTAVDIVALLITYKDTAPSLPPYWVTAVQYRPLAG